MASIHYTQNGSSIKVDGDLINDIGEVLEEVVLTLTTVINGPTEPTVEEKVLSRSLANRSFALFVGEDVYFSSESRTVGLDCFAFSSNTSSIVWEGRENIFSCTRGQFTSVGNKIYVGATGAGIATLFSEVLDLSTGEDTQINLGSQRSRPAVVSGGGNVFYLQMAEATNAGDIVDASTHAVTAFSFAPAYPVGDRLGAIWAQYYNGKLYIVPAAESLYIIEYTVATGKSKLLQLLEPASRRSLVVIRDKVYAPRNASSPVLDVFDLTTGTASTITLVDNLVTRKGIVCGNGKLYITRNVATNPAHLQYVDVVDITTQEVTRFDLGVQAKRGHPAYHKRKLVIPREENTNRFDVVSFA
jgi:hypothetical protein